MKIIKKNIFILLFTISLVLALSSFFLKNIFGEKLYPIHIAVIKGDINKIEKLLKEGTDINLTDSRGRTPLYWAALNGSKEVVEYLLSKGAKNEIGASWKDYNTPLHVAAQNGHDDVIITLLNTSINPNIKNSHGQTPLHLAAWSFHPGAVKILLEKGANPNAQDKRGYTPMHVENIFQPINSSYKKVIELLISAGAEIDAKTKSGDTPLMGACIIGDEDVAELLISKGANINAKTKDDVTPLSLAIAYKHKSLEEILRKNGAKEIEK